MMKRVYSRPSIYVERVSLDNSIAATNCLVGLNDPDIVALRRFGGYFAPDLGCDWYEEGIRVGYQTVCYHSNVRNLLSS